MKGGRGWHWAVVCPGTTTGRHSTPAFSPVPVDPQADCHSTHTLTQDAVMRVFGFCIHEAPETVFFLFYFLTPGLHEMGSCFPLCV